jgi:hypothetical protein
MNLVAAIIASAISMIFLTAIGQGIVGMHRAQDNLVYLQDKATAVFAIQSAMNCQKTKPNGNSCDSGSIDLKTQTGQSLASTSTGWKVGRAIITAQCHADGIEIFSHKDGTNLAPEPLFPIRLCGNL